MALSLKRRLAARARLSAMFVTEAAPDLVEMIGHAGIDFVVIDAEHGALSASDVATLVRAADVTGMPALVRVAELTKSQVLAPLDAGAAGILAPAIETPTDVDRLLAFARYPPHGDRSAAHYTRAMRYSHGFTADAFAIADAETVIGIVIETPAGIANAARLLDLPGVDVVFPGRIDLALRQPPADGRLADVRDALAGLATLAEDRGRSIAAALGPDDAADSLVAQGHNILFTALAPLMVRSLHGFAQRCAGAL